MVETDKDGRLKRGQRVMIVDWVYCLNHGTVHVNSTNPFGRFSHQCLKEEHRPVSWTARAGDYP